MCCKQVVEHSMSGGRRGSIKGLEALIILMRLKFDAHHVISIMADCLRILLT